MEVGEKLGHLHFFNSLMLRFSPMFLFHRNKQGVSVKRPPTPFISWKSAYWTALNNSRRQQITLSELCSLKWSFHFHFHNHAHPFSPSWHEDGTMTLA
jgi:hypothetical protein